MSAKWIRGTVIAVVCVLQAACAATSPQSDSELASFCDRLPRAAYAAFEQHPAGDDWFEVYEVAPSTFAIYEPFQWQEVISYLIIGSERALLFDTGNGIGDIRRVVEGLTGKPLIVMNSHAHYDHVGGNHLFDDIRSVATAFTMQRAQGMEHEEVAIEVSDEALCKPLPDGVSADKHFIRGFSISARIDEGDIIDLGDRQLEVLRIPGHTDDSIALIERAPGFLWSGDSFYEGPIWLYAPETDFTAYRASLARLAALAPELTAVFPAHNTPRAAPSLLADALRAFDRVRRGEVPPTPAWEGTVTYEFEGFAFLTRDDAFAGDQP